MARLPNQTAIKKAPEADYHRLKAVACTRGLKALFRPMAPNMVSAPSGL